MSEELLEPFDAELDALLDAERRARPPLEALDRVWSRLGGIPPPGGNGAPTPRPGWLASHAAAVAVAAFAVGGVTGAGVYAATQKPPPERIVYVDRPLPPPAIAAVTTSPGLPTTAPPIPALSAAPRPSAPPASPESLSAERAFLDQARSDLARGDAADALARLEDHTHKFRKPQLSEEREALAIQALVTLARYDEARARAARFREASPNSLFVPAIEAALASIP
jgi:hypothetical protein